MSYQRLRRPLKEELELELKKRIEDILINNFKEQKRTTRFDFDLIKKLCKQILTNNNDDKLDEEQLFPS